MGDGRIEPEFSISTSSFQPEYQIAWPNENETFNKESARLNTYRDWPLSFVAPQDLARNGFVYLKTNDRVQCCFCYGILSDWELGDTPAQEHRKHFKDCPFIQDPSGTDNLSLEDASRGLRQPVRHQPLEVRTFDVCGTRPLNAESRNSLKRRKSSTHEVFKNLNIIEHYEPKIPSYATPATRLKSYDTWPKALPQDVNKMVEAGLFYTGFNDKVQCFQCGLTLRDWTANDDPFEEHAYWNPDCPFINLVKGKEFIERVRKTKSSVSKEEKTGVQHECHEATARDVPAASETVEDTENSSTVSTNSNRTSSSSQASESEESSQNTCKICWNREKNVVFLPCRHLVACVQCAAELNTCPICRSDIKGKVHTYLA